MKISYERLNEIIEEEVSRFKRLNEQTIANVPTNISDVSGATSFIKSILSPVTPYKSVAELKAAVTSAISKIPG
jgi:hypothetical protein